MLRAADDWLTVSVSYVSRLFSYDEIFTYWTLFHSLVFFLPRDALRIFHGRYITRNLANNANI